MSSRSRRRRPGKSRSKKGETYDISILPNGAVTAVAAPPEAMWRYLELHALVPDDIHLWPAARVRAMAREVDHETRVATWERTLLLLAHHRSQLAHDLLVELEPKVRASLQPVWEMARGESLGWMGNDVHQDGEGNLTVAPLDLAEMVWGPPRAGNN